MLHEFRRCHRKWEMWIKRIEMKRIKNASHTYPHLAHSNMQCVCVGGIICLLIVLFFLFRIVETWDNNNSGCFDLSTFSSYADTHVRTNKYFRKREESVSDDRFSRKRLQGVLWWRIIRITREETMPLPSLRHLLLLLWVYSFWETIGDCFVEIVTFFCQILRVRWERRRCRAVIRKVKSMTTRRSGAQFLSAMGGPPFVRLFIKRRALRWKKRCKACVNTSKMLR